MIALVIIVVCVVYVIVGGITFELLLPGANRIPLDVGLSDDGNARFDASLAWPITWPVMFGLVLVELVRRALGRRAAAKLPRATVRRRP